MSNATTEVREWKETMRHEFIEYWMTVLYLALFFGTFTMYRRLILAHHEIEYLNYGFALIQALVLGKVVLLGEWMHLGRLFQNRPLLLPTLVKAAVFTVFVAAFKIAEHTIGGLLHGAGPTAGFHDFIGKGRNELLASSLVVFFTFIPFFAFRELNRVLGKGKIRKLFFTKQVR